MLLVVCIGRMLSSGILALTRLGGGTMLSYEELKERARTLCEKLELSPCDVMIHVKMDDYVGILVRTKVAVWSFMM